MDLVTGIMFTVVVIGMIALYIKGRNKSEKQMLEAVKYSGEHYDSLSKRISVLSADLSMTDKSFTKSIEFVESQSNAQIKNLSGEIQWTKKALVSKTDSLTNNINESAAKSRDSVRNVNIELKECKRHFTAELALLQFQIDNKPKFEVGSVAFLGKEKVTVSVRNMEAVNEGKISYEYLVQTLSGSQKPATEDQLSKTKLKA